jgi:hypothetical protein
MIAAAFWHTNEPNGDNCTTKLMVRADEASGDDQDGGARH